MTERASEKLKKDLETLKAHLIQEKDELKVQMHLAKMEAKAEWAKAELEWEDFISHVRSAFDRTGSAAEETLNQALNLGQGMKKRFKNLKDKIKESVEV